jgi:hypothetical protein
MCRRNDDAVMREILDTFAGWIEAIEARGAAS